MSQSDMADVDVESLSEDEQEKDDLQEPTSSKNKPFTADFLDIARDKTGLDDNQIKNWIRRENMKEKHKVSTQSDGAVFAPKKQRSTWHQYLKEYGESEGGKKAIRDEGNPSSFNRKASEQYKQLSAEEREALEIRAKQQAHGKSLSKKEVLKAAENIFSKVQQLFDELDQLGFKGFAIAFREHYTQVVGTSGTSFTPDVVEWLHALVVVANPPVKERTSCKRSPSPDPKRPRKSSPHKSSSTQKPLPSIHRKKKSPSSIPPEQKPPIRKVASPTSLKKTPTTSSNLKPPLPPISPPTSPKSPSLPEPPTTKLLPEPPATKPLPEPPTTKFLPESPATKPLPAEKVWIKNSLYTLQVEDKKILESTLWLNDQVVDAAQILLQKHCNGKVIGWQSTLYEQARSHFTLIQDDQMFVQVILVGKCHWITVSNVVSDQSAGVINVYDILSNNITVDTMCLICSFWQSSLPQATFRVMNTLKQTNDYDYGLFALACATELAFRKDPLKAYWNVETMRTHLQTCLTNGELSRFPQKRERRVPLSNLYRSTVTKALLCICKTPNNRKRAMIKCSGCLLWFHNSCMNLDPETNYDAEQWFCCTCMPE